MHVRFIRARTIFAYTGVPVRLRHVCFHCRIWLEHGGFVVFNEEPRYCCTHRDCMRQFVESTLVHSHSRSMKEKSHAFQMDYEMVP